MYIIFSLSLGSNFAKFDLNQICRCYQYSCIFIGIVVISTDLSCSLPGNVSLSIIQFSIHWLNIYQNFGIIYLCPCAVCTQTVMILTSLSAQLQNGVKWKWFPCSLLPCQRFGKTTVCLSMVFVLFHLDPLVMKKWQWCYILNKTHSFRSCPFPSFQVLIIWLPR